MKNKVRELRGLIYSHYDSESSFAAAMQWPRQKLNRITSGNKIPSIDEIDAMARGLNIPIGEMAKIFLRQKSTNE